MKCLSICQPFANLILEGKKTIELRKWNTEFRGEFLVHAPRKIRIDDCERLKIKTNLNTGVIIGKVDLVGVKKYENELEVNLDSKKHLASNYARENKYGFILEKPKQLKVPIPYNGQLNFFEFKPEMLTSDEIKMDLFDEEHRYMWINHH